MGLRSRPRFQLSERSSSLGLFHADAALSPTASYLIVPPRAEPRTNQQLTVITGHEPS